MPTETKPANRIGELEDQLAALEDQRRQAADAIAQADHHTQEITARHHEIAVAVVSKDADAAAENERLEEALLIQNRRRITAKSAAQQLDGLIAEAKEAITAERRQAHLKRATALGRERYELEEQAEEQVAALVQTLDELKGLDTRQRGALAQGGNEQNGRDFVTWNSNLRSWLRTRLHTYGGSNPQHGEYTTKSLPQLDPLAYRPREDKGA